MITGIFQIDKNLKYKDGKLVWTDEAKAKHNQSAWLNNALSLEVIYSNIITIMVGLFAAVFERGLEQIVYSKPLKAVILTLFLVSFCLYLIFTFKTPWADVFVVPKWK